jgi:hypothetical protein
MQGQKKEQEKSWEESCGGHFVYFPGVRGGMAADSLHRNSSKKQEKAAPTEKAAPGNITEGMASSGEGTAETESK